MRFPHFSQLFWIVYSIKNSLFHKNWFSLGFWKNSVRNIYLLSNQFIIAGKALNVYSLLRLNDSFLLYFSFSFLLEFFFLYKSPAIPSSLDVDSILSLQFLARSNKLNTILSAKYILSILTSLSVSFKI